MAQASVISPARTPAPARLVFIDNLRWVMIVLVITMHAAVTYSNMGRWYYTEEAPLSLGSRLFFATYQVWLQAFFMGFLFFIAGYFVPPAFDRKRSRTLPARPRCAVGNPIAALSVHNWAGDHLLPAAPEAVR